jgi:hypothetical protein
MQWKRWMLNLVKLLLLKVKKEIPSILLMKDSMTVLKSSMESKLTLKLIKQETFSVN